MRLQLNEGRAKGLNLRVRGDITNATHSLDSLRDDLITADNQRTDRRIVRQERPPGQFNTVSDVTLVLDLIISVSQTFQRIIS